MKMCRAIMSCMKVHIVMLLSCALGVLAVPLPQQHSRHSTSPTNAVAGGGGARALQPDTSDHSQSIRRRLPQEQRLRVIKIGAESSDGHNTSNGGGARPGEYDPGVPQYPPGPQYPPAGPQYTPVNPQYPPAGPQYYPANPAENIMSSPVFDVILPRTLNPGDKVTISGTVSSSASEFTVILATGSYNIDFGNIAFQYRVDFANNRVVLSLTKNGQLKEMAQAEVLFTPGGNWDLRLEMERNEIIVLIDGSYHSALDLEHGLHEIRYLQAFGHINSVKTLAFEFA